MLEPCHAERGNNGRSDEQNWEGKKEEKQGWCNLNGNVWASNGLQLQVGIKKTGQDVKSEKVNRCFISKLSKTKVH